MYKVLIISLFVVIGCKEQPKQQDPKQEESGIKFSDIQLRDLENKPYELKNTAGKTVFINFWATWCRPCLEEMPSLQRLQSKLGNENVIFLLASNESIEEIVAFKKSAAYNFNYLRIDNLEALNIEALPTTLIFDSDGMQVFSEMGARKWDDSSNTEMLLKIIHQK